MIELINKHGKTVFFALEAKTVIEALDEVRRAGVTLPGLRLADQCFGNWNLFSLFLPAAHILRCDFRGSSLVSCDFTNANFVECDLTGADLSGSEFGGVTFLDSNLTGVCLTGTRLLNATIRDSNLTAVDFACVDLRGVDLGGANLGKTGDLSVANLTAIRDDLWAVLSSAPREVPGLLAALRDGRIDGSHYAGDCRCLVGTIEKLRGYPEWMRSSNPKRDSWRHAERFFLAIRPGDTPENSQIVRIVYDWVNHWLVTMRQVFGAGI